MKTGFPKSLKTGEKFCFKTVDSAVYNADGRTVADHLTDLRSANAANVNAINVERGRINNIIAESTEGTVDNAELIDIRTGQDEVVYATAGDAVRGQFLSVFNAIKEITKYTKNSAPEDANLYNIINHNNTNTELHTDYVIFPTICKVSVPNGYQVKVIIYEYVNNAYNFIHDSDWVTEYIVPKDYSVIIQLKHSDDTVITKTEIAALTFLYEYPDGLKRTALENASFYNSLQYEYENTDTFTVDRISSPLIWIQQSMFVSANPGYQCCIISFTDNKDGTFTQYHTYEWANKQFIPAYTPCIISFRKENNSMILFDEFINNFNFSNIHHYNVFFNNVLNTLSFTGVIINENNVYTYGSSTGRLLSNTLESDTTVTLYVTDIYSTTKIAYHILDENGAVIYDSQWATMITIPSNTPVRVFIKDDSEVINPECIYDIDSKNTTDINANPFIKDIAHRGLSKYAPENTLVAFKYAKIQGFQYVECDVKFTSDNIPVILHDDTIDRTARDSSGNVVTGNIKDLTFEQVSQYDFGYWFKESPTDVRIPSFNDFIQFCKKSGLYPYIHIDISPFDETYIEKIDNLIDIVLWYGMLKHVTWISFTVENLQRIKERVPFARLGLLPRTEITQDIIDAAISLRENHDGEVFIDSSSFSEDECALCRNNGLPLELWTIDDVNTIAGIDQYFSGVTSNSLQIGKIFIQAYDLNT